MLFVPQLVWVDGTISCMGRKLKVAAVRSLLSVSKSFPIQTTIRGDKISGLVGLLI